jgi:hypothetical protein
LGPARRLVEPFAAPEAIPVATIVAPVIPIAIPMPLEGLTFAPRQADGFAFSHFAAGFRRATFTGAAFSARLAIKALTVLILLLDRLRRAEGITIRGRVEIIILVIAIIERAAHRSLLGLHRRSDQPIIVLGMLEITLGCHRITRKMRVARKLGVFLGDMLCGATHFHIRTV